MALHQKSPPDVEEVLSRLRAKLVTTLEEAGRSARSTGHAIGLFTYFVRVRVRLGDVLALFQQTSAAKIDEVDELVLREAQLSFLRRREQFHTAETRSDLIRAWNDLLVDAAAKVARDRRDSALYADDAREMDDDDREWYEGARRVAGERWSKS